MTGTLINAGTILIGSIIGLMLRSRLQERFTEVMFQVFGLFTLFLGVKMALETDNIMVLIFSLLVGTLLGEWWRMERGMERIGEFIKTKTKSDNARFSEGLVTAFLIFCVGSLTILGAIEEGLGQRPNLLLTKSLMDGFSSMALAAALGSGVLFSIIPLLIFQGGLTLFASFLSPVLSPEIVAEISAVGGVMLIGLGFVLLDLKKIRVINMLPSLIVVVFLAKWLPPLLEKLF